MTTAPCRGLSLSYGRLTLTLQPRDRGSCGCLHIKCKTFLVWKECKKIMKLFAKTQTAMNEQIEIKWEVLAAKSPAIGGVECGAGPELRPRAPSPLENPCGRRWKGQRGDDAGEQQAGRGKLIPGARWWSRAACWSRCWGARTRSRSWYWPYSWGTWSQGGGRPWSSSSCGPAWGQCALENEKGNFWKEFC